MGVLALGSAVPSVDVLTVPACKGLALRVSRGQLLQVCDVWAFSTAAHHVSPEGLLKVAMSMHLSHDFMGKLCPAVGDTLVSAQSKPMLTLIEDTGPGVHDTTVAACSHELYERVLGISPDDHHDSCTNNLHTALAALGLKLTDEREFYSTPAPINLWMSTPSLSGATDTDSLWGVPDPRQRPGDQVVWRCETDLVVVMSACPASDVSRVNGASGSHDVHCRVWDVI